MEQCGGYIGKRDDVFLVESRKIISLLFFQLSNFKSLNKMEKQTKNSMKLFILEFVEKRLVLFLSKGKNGVGMNPFLCLFVSVLASPPNSLDN